MGQSDRSEEVRRKKSDGFRPAKKRQFQVGAGTLPEIGRNMIGESRMQERSLGPFDDDLERRVEERTRALTDALGRQTALSESLKRVIGRSGSALDAVLEGLIESAVTLSGANWGVIYRLEHGMLRPAAFHGLDEERRARWAGVALELNRRSAAGRCVVDRQVVEIPDVRLDSEYGLGDASRTVGWRSLLAVPLFRDEDLLGVIAVQRTEAGSFGDATSLLTVLANQAVIAIENARQLKETREALQQQTATAEVLKVISASPNDVQPVFDI